MSKKAKHTAPEAQEPDEPGTPEPKAKAKASKPPGVCATIKTILEANGPIDQPSIHKRLVKKFPARDPDSMRNTIKLFCRGQYAEKYGIQNQDGKFFIKVNEPQSGGRHAAQP